MDFVETHDGGTFAGSAVDHHGHCGGGGIRRGH